MGAARGRRPRGPTPTATFSPVDEPSTRWPTARRAPSGRLRALVAGCATAFVLLVGGPVDAGSASVTSVPPGAAERADEARRVDTAPPPTTTVPVGAGDGSIDQRAAFPSSSPSDDGARASLGWWSAALAVGAVVLALGVALPGRRRR